jgi:uncharacterized low-complexity protein
MSESELKTQKRASDTDVEQTQIEKKTKLIEKLDTTTLSTCTFLLPAAVASSSSSSFVLQNSLPTAILPAAVASSSSFVLPAAVASSSDSSSSVKLKKPKKKNKYGKCTHGKCEENGYPARWFTKHDRTLIRCESHHLCTYEDDDKDKRCFQFQLSKVNRKELEKENDSGLSLSHLCMKHALITLKKGKDMMDTQSRLETPVTSAPSLGEAIMCALSQQDAIDTEEWESSQLDMCIKIIHETISNSLKC